jgi:hypothetical protein
MPNITAVLYRKYNYKEWYEFYPKYRMFHHNRGSFFVHSFYKGFSPDTPPQNHIDASFGVVPAFVKGFQIRRYSL